MEIFLLIIIIVVWLHFKSDKSDRSIETEQSYKDEPSEKILSVAERKVQVKPKV